MHVREVAVKRFEKGREMVAKEWVVEEKRCTILMNGRDVAALSACPEMLKELGVGHVVGEGLPLEEVKEVEVGDGWVNVVTENPVDVETLQGEWNQVIKCAGASDFCVRAPVVLESVSRLHTDTEVWGKTHGVHSAALFTKEGELLVLAEDVSRHSAFEKVLGKALLEGRDLNQTFVAVSGRISQDMVVKARNVGIFVIASHSTVIEPAVTAAVALNVTLIGFVRGDHVVVFSHPERVVG